MDLVGRTLGQYEIIEPLGKGGMATVYKAYQSSLQRHVALKVLSPALAEDPDLVRRFLREAQSAAALHHPNVIVIHDVGSDEDIHYIVAEYLEGVTLAQLLEVTGDHGGTLPLDRILHIVRQVSDALDYAHARGYVHRDIKPSNIMVDPARDDHVTLMDFGLVQVTGGSRITRTGFIMGTPDYMSPEQAKGETVDRRTDIYSLGVTTYHMLTGDVPFAKPTPHAILMAHIMEEPPAMSAPLGTTPTEVEAVVLKSMAKDPADRYEWAGELAGDLELASSAPAFGDFAALGAPAEDPVSGRSTTLEAAIPRTPPLGTIRPQAPPGAPAYTTSPPQALGAPSAQALGAPSPQAQYAQTPPGGIPLSAGRPRWVWPVLGAAATAFVVVLVILGILLAPSIVRLLPSTARQATLTRASSQAPAIEPTATPTLAASTVESTATPTAMPTETANQSLSRNPSTATPVSLTNTPLPTATPAPPTNTPLPTAMPVSAAHTPLPTTPAATPTRAPLIPTATPPPAPSSGVLISFEQWGTWTRGEQPYGELIQTEEQVQTGRYAARLSYDFPETDQDFVVYRQATEIGGEPNAISVWVYGDGSAHFLNVWIEDAKQQVWSVHLGRIGPAGWQQMTGRIDPNRPWPSGHVFGPQDEVIDYPIRFYGLALDRPAAGPTKGTIYLDELSVGQVEAPGPGETPESVGPPLSSGGRIVFTVQAGEQYSLYATDPSWETMVKLGDTDRAHSTCAEGNAAITLEGLTVQLRPPERCSVAGTVDSCSSPNGQFKVNTNRTGDDYQVTLWRTSDNKMLEAIYTGPLNIHPGINWSPDSSHFLFTIGQSVYRADVGQAGYHMVIPFKHDTWPLQYTPDGVYVYYVKPVSGAISDVFLARPDGTGERNLTHSPIAVKLCPRWRQ